MLHIKVRLPVPLCAVKTVEGDFRFCWTISPNVGQTPRVGNFIIGASGSDKQMLCGSSVARAAPTISAANKNKKG